MRTPWWLFFACLLVAAGCSDSEHPTAVQVSSLDQAAPAADPPAAGVQGEFWPGEPPPLLPAECFYDPASELEGFGLPAMSVADFREQQVIRNAWIVKAAAEAFAAENGGVYSVSIGDATPLGNTLIDFLPGGCLLTNPYNLCCDTPGMGPVTYGGQVGYRMRDLNGDCVPDGCLIDGLGKHQELICLLIGP
jgi:hypothetical protein